MNILSIQSHVSYGHVGNSAAVFAMQRLGAEVWPVNTVAFSNHPGHGGFAGRVIDAAEIAALIAGIAKLGVLARCDALISGYLGAAETGPVVLQAVATARRANPALLFCCDPVIGDAGPGLYVRPGLPEFMRDQAMPAADMVTPNQFELEYLSGARATTQKELLGALAHLHGRGPKTILVTSVITAETPPDAIDIVASDGREAYLLRTPRLGRDFNGAGDAMAALFLVHFLRSNTARQALAEAAASVFGILKRTVAGASRELLLIEAQDELVTPSERFPVEAIGRLA
ncbi:pyridoxine kinase [Rhizobiales bacterium GAS191]|nr:pyridoxine kinase [Rhizobiales bacterium GAS113]SED96841.1 pyridoxine kinase [Rhizobiales bacterium GAS191]SEE51530.1 pyridoxine kinase [Rhizobiales bacterium GAS188]